MTGMMLAVLLFALVAVHECNGDCSNKQVRLYNGTSADSSEGMLQICNNRNRWTAVCDYRWTQALSIKACRILGHSNPSPITYINSRVRWPTFGFVATRSSSCRSTTSLTSSTCLSTSSFRLNSPIYCLNSRDTIYLNCTPSIGSCTNRDIRIYNSTHANSNIGMLQICNNQNKWTAVCDYSWGCSESKVACKHLGYSNAIPLYSTNGGPWNVFGYGPYRYCSSSTTSLFFCSTYSSTYRTNDNYCNPLRDTVQIKCLNGTTDVYNNCSSNYAVRLTGGPTSNEGTAEVCYQNKWTSFCTRYMNQRVASTICNQLGFKGNSFATVITDGRYDSGTTTDFFSSSYCRSGNTYDSIRYCSLTLANSCNINGCRYNRVGIKCFNPQNCNEGDVRLMNGTVEREGRLEICASGVWGSICTTNFAKSAAYVACKQLGHNDVNGAIIDTVNKYGVGNGPIVYSNVECFGHESSLNSCTKTVYPSFYCSNRVVGLVCLDLCDEGDVRLVGTNSSNEGLVEVCLDKSWGLVAQHGWDDGDARIVCKQLGARDPAAGVAVYNSSYAKPKRAVRYSNVHCNGNEDMLTDCIHHTFDFNYGRTLFYMPVAAVNCGIDSSPTTTSMRNTASPSAAAVANNPRETQGMFVGGIVFFVIGILILLIAIAVMVAVVLRMRKISISQSGRNNYVEGAQTMSQLKTTESKVELTKHASIRSDDYDVPVLQ